MAREHKRIELETLVKRANVTQVCMYHFSDGYEAHAAFTKLHEAGFPIRMRMKFGKGRFIGIKWGEWQTIFDTITDHKED